MSLIWATRGRTWGFRFLRNGGFADPLVEYDKAFSRVEDAATVYRRTGTKVALRFPDPDEREDAAGRVIPHEFIVDEPLASEIHSVEDAVRMVWPLVSADFDGVWDLPEPPASCRDAANTDNDTP